MAVCDEQEVLSNNSPQGGFVKLRQVSRYHATIIYGRAIVAQSKSGNPIWTDAVLNRDADKAVELLRKHYTVTSEILLSSGHFE